MGTPEQEALEKLARGTLRAHAPLAWQLFERAWPALDQRVGTYLRSLRLAQEFREDCGQNTFMRVWRFRETYRGHSLDEFCAWLYRIARHEAQRLTDRARRLPVREADAAQETAIADLLPGGVGDVSGDRLQAEESAQALEQCMDGLEDGARELVELLYGPEPNTERAAAVILNISKSYVNTLRHRALDALAHCLRGKGFDE